MHQILYISDTSLIAELAERSPIIIQISSNQLSRKNWVYDRTTLRPYKVPLLTCVINCTAGISALRLCPVVQWSVHWAQGRTTRVLVLAGARRCALETYGKKNCELRFQAWLNLNITYVMNSFAFTHFCGTNYKAVLPIEQNECLL